MSKLEGKRISRRMAITALILGGLFVLCALIVIGRLVIVQLIDYDYYHAQVMNETTYEQDVNPSRGTIYDRNGNILAGNKTVYLCFISPQDILNDINENQTKYTWTSSDGVTHTDVLANEIIAGYLSEKLDVEKSFILEKASLEKRYYEKIKEKIDENVAEEIRTFLKEHELTHMVYLSEGTLRYYPNGTSASHVVGFLNSDGTGRSGLELYYNNILEGTGGRYVGAKDAKSNEIDYKYATTIEAENGYDIYTTIDSYIQYELEKVLNDTLVENQAANRVTGIVTNVKTGEVYAMATTPGFDLNSPYELDSDSLQKLEDYKTDEQREEDARDLAEKSYLKENPDTDKEAEGYDALIDAYYKQNHDTYYEAAYDSYYKSLLYVMWKNKAISELYEPGSTSKIITTAMAFEEGVTTPEESFYCGGSYMVEGYASPISCHETAGHGQVSYARGLQQSCNPCLMQVGLRLGRQTYYQYFQDFGYTSITGIDLPSESRSIYHSFENFSNVSLAVYSFGQTYKTTAIQQITAIGAIANGGYIVTPHLLKEVTNQDNKTITSYETDVKRQVISSDVCEEVTQILADGVATDGGARNARVNGYRIAAKTGTSEKIDVKDSTGQTYLRLGSCIGYGPANDPEVAVIIVVDEPMGGSVYGSVVAAPYVSEVMSNILPYLGYEATYTDESTEIAETTIVDYKDWEVVFAKSAVTNNGMTAVVVGGGDIVSSVYPEPGSTMAKEGGKVILFTNGTSDSGKVTVPDLTGRSAENARNILNDLNLNIRYTGTTSSVESQVIAQNVQAGTEVPTGSIIEVTMRVTSGGADD